MPTDEVDICFVLFSEGNRNLFSRVRFATRENINIWCLRKDINFSYQEKMFFVFHAFSDSSKSSPRWYSLIWQPLSSVLWCIKYFPNRFPRDLGSIPSYARKMFCDSLFPSLFAYWLHENVTSIFEIRHTCVEIYVLKRRKSSPASWKLYSNNIYGRFILALTIANVLLSQQTIATERIGWS